MAGAVALWIIAATARLTEMPLVFPPLAASAFILFNSPMAESASPRNVLLSHSAGLIFGVFSLTVVSAIFPFTDPGSSGSISWIEVGAIAMAMGLVSIAMIFGRFIHPPAAATALIAAMGYVDSFTHLFGFLAAVILLLVEAWIFNRVLGGIPYPTWRWNAENIKVYRALAGLEDQSKTRNQDIRYMVSKR